MKRASYLLFFCLLPSALCGQEAGAGADVRATLSGELAASSVFTQADVAESPVTGGFRAVVYPTFKFSDQWTVTGAWQLESRPYYFEGFSNKDRGVSGNLLQGSLNYSRLSGKGSLVVRAGILSTSFGSFLLRYDDAENPLADLPLEYGYYYSVVSTLGLGSAQIDATRGKFDGRIQLASSSPANPRSVFAKDQYGNWMGGGGYTIRQGLRVGVSGYRGPYLDRKYGFFLPGEANPNKLLAHAVGVDVQWTRYHWNVQGEFQRFVLPYTVIPNFGEDAGYSEVRRALGPRWYAAIRTGYTSATFGGNTERYEFGAGFRPCRNELLKVDYELDHHSQGSVSNDNTLVIQFVSSLRFSRAVR